MSEGPTPPGWHAMAGLHPGDPRLATRIGRRLSGLPGRWRWGIERLLHWWFAELATMAGRAKAAAGTSLHVAEDDVLDVTAPLTPDTIALAADRAALLIGTRTPFAPADIVAGYRLEPDGGAVRLRVRLVPLGRLAGSDPAAFDTLCLGGENGDMPIAVRVPLPSERRAALAAAQRRGRVVACACGLAAAIALLVPIVLRQRALAAEQAQLEESRGVLAPALRRAAAVRAERTAADEARRLKARAPSSVLLLDRLSRIIDDDSYLTELRLTGRDATITGVSAAASALPGRIEADRAFEKVRLSAPVSRNPADGRQRFEIALTAARR